MLGNVWEEIAIGQPETDDERAEIAGLCMLKLDIELPMLVLFVVRAMKGSARKPVPWKVQMCHR